MKTKEPEMLYFAYGSNMDLKQMKFRCKDSQKFCNGRLVDYKLVERLHADVEESKGDDVHGVLLFISHNDLKALDIYEGFPTYYDRKIVPVETEYGIFHAIVYEMTRQCKRSRDWQEYSPRYRELCSQASIDNGLPRNDFTNTWCERSRDLAFKIAMK